jgi:alanine racemase
VNASLLIGIHYVKQNVDDKAGTNRNEFISIIGRRVPRVYLKDEQVVDIVDYLLD